jgi:hypothetical protein
MMNDGKLEDLKEWLESADAKRAMEEIFAAAAKRSKELRKARRVSLKTQNEPCTI